MKSKRAEEYIDDSRVYSDFYDGCGFIVSEGDASSAVEIAEEDMAEKASKAFCFCKCGIGPCIMQQVGRDECKDLREFKRKMEE